MNLTRHSPVLFGALFVCLCAALPASGAKGAYFMYIGTYTGEKSKGIYAFRFDAGNGKSEPLGLLAETPSPSFVAIHPSRRYLYAVNEISNYQGQRSGAVVAYAIDPKTGKTLFRTTAEGGGTVPLKTPEFETDIALRLLRPWTKAMR
jgi:6-phosphogluconolactonase